MVTWNNLDTLASFQDLSRSGKRESCRGNVRRERCRRCEELQRSDGRGLSYNYAAKQVDDKVLEHLKSWQMKLSLQTS